MVIVDQLYSRLIYGDAQYVRESSADWSATVLTAIQDGIAQWL